MATLFVIPFKITEIYYYNLRLFVKLALILGAYILYMF